MAMTNNELTKKLQELNKQEIDYKEPEEKPVKPLSPEDIAAKIRALDLIRKQKRKEEHTRNVGAFMGTARRLF